MLFERTKTYQNISSGQRIETYTSTINYFKIAMTFFKL